MLRPLPCALSHRGGRARLSILIFHRVQATPDPSLPDEVDGAPLRPLAVYAGGPWTLRGLAHARKLAS